MAEEAEKAACAAMKYRLEAVQEEKAAGDGSFFGMVGLPLGVWLMYSYCMSPPGEMDDAAKLCYVVKRIGPTVFVQWAHYEIMAKTRIALARLGRAPHPWEPIGRLGGGKPEPMGLDALNPSFYALWDRVCQNNLESTVLNTLGIMCLSQYCYGPMYDVRVAVALGYMHAIGMVIYAYAYAGCGPNHRMYGFIIRGFWACGATPLFCIIRCMGFFEEDPISLFWGCQLGLVVFLILAIGVVKSKFVAPEGTMFGYTFQELKDWVPADVEGGYRPM
eukprot:TRINITY_DN5038_c0_g1_i1.p1 TRINITY_DN5038_c0_g1~~TRINITY_DN5038_c0_g1_i1.p1  ORF type:complete len:275 (-),score=47.06 TRINITY_DN5038_c0_g1_i1:317-1141(-)